MDQSRFEDDLLREYLTGRDVACPQCNYNLRNLVGTKCPECGEALRLRVSPVEPRQAAPLTGLVILSAGAGLNVLLLIYAAIVYSQRGDGGWLRTFIRVNGSECLIMATAVTVWLLNWRRIRSLRAAFRWTLVVFCAALTLADVLYFTARNK